ncbi:hypothetical protein [Larkinella knui]|uniref:Lipocalin-like domain-containing protein n=1 Tax=Larkinella knui TaxID=2025310 RepID=A0A3P1CCR1_9BACT|nr:hypothetical protein [Larkinella knui]RRB10876.1 hypothetical protein EHT87_27410 [Larkinella knui]
MKRLSIYLMLLLVSAGCSKKKVAPLSERLQRIWTANVVREGGTMVYTKGGAANIRPGYVGFVLDLSSAAGVTLKDVDGSSVTGQWEVSSDEKRLILKGLTPPPSGTNGTIEFTIGTLTESQLTLVRTTTSLKTGGSINTYELTSP